MNSGRIRRCLELECYLMIFALRAPATSFLILLGTSLAVLACSSPDPRPDPTATVEPQPSPTPTLTVQEASRECREQARSQAVSRYGVDALKLTEDFNAFEGRLKRVGDPYGIPLSWNNTDDVTDDILDSILFGFLGPPYNETVATYESLADTSPYVSPEGTELYRSLTAGCPEQTAFVSSRNPPTDEEVAILSCVIQALLEIESLEGMGSVDYTTAFQNFAKRRRGTEFVDYLIYEAMYTDLLDRSPFANPTAMDAFRKQARLCPE